MIVSAMIVRFLTFLNHYFMTGSKKIKSRVKKNDVIPTPTEVILISSSSDNEKVKKKKVVKKNDSTTNYNAAPIQNIPELGSNSRDLPLLQRQTPHHASRLKTEKR